LEKAFFCEDVLSGFHVSPEVRLSRLKNMISSYYIIFLSINYKSKKQYKNYVEKLPDCLSTIKLAFFICY